MPNLSDLLIGEHFIPEPSESCSSEQGHKITSLSDEALRDQVCEAFDTWLRLRTVPASAVRDTRSTPALIRQASGQSFSQHTGDRPSTLRRS